MLGELGIWDCVWVGTTAENDFSMNLATGKDTVHLPLCLSTKFYNVVTANECLFCSWWTWILCF